MRERAAIRSRTGKTRHVVGGADVTAQIAWLEIERDDGGWYLFYFDAGGEMLTDTWHETRSLAKQQAHFEFGTEEVDWQQLPT